MQMAEAEAAARRAAAEKSRSGGVLRGGWKRSRSDSELMRQQRQGQGQHEPSSTRTLLQVPSPPRLAATLPPILTPLASSPLASSPRPMVARVVENLLDAATEASGRVPEEYRELRNEMRSMKVEYRELQSEMHAMRDEITRAIARGKR